MTAAPTGSASAPRRRLRAARPLRAVAAVYAGLVFLQAAFAGQSLSGNTAALALHEVNGTEILTWVALVQFVLAVLVWRPGRGPAWPALLTGLLVPLGILQIGLGFSRQLALHVPLGVAMFGLSLAVLLGTRGLRPTPQRPGTFRCAAARRAGRPGRGVRGSRSRR